MARSTTTTTATIDLSELDQSDLKDYIQSKYSPEDVFPESELTGWATDNGFAKSEA